MKREPFWSNDALITASGVADQELPSGALYVVATPIGNAADITLRALWVLSQMDAIACEDTRTTRPLLERYGIAATLLAAHEHNERAAAERIIARLTRGERIALLTDAGTPAISDPGARLVRAVRAAGQRVIPVPGASSLTAAASAAGLQEASLTLIGFLPRAARSRERVLREATDSGQAFVLFEAPHRIVATAAALAAVLPRTRRVVVARELTKKFEAIVETTAGELVAWVAQSVPRGEYVVLVDAAEEGARDREGGIDAQTRRWLDALAAELPAARAAGLAARITGLPRAILYAALTGKPEA